MTTPTASAITTRRTSQRAWSMRAQDRQWLRPSRLGRRRCGVFLTEALDDRRVRHTAALAHRLQAVAAAAALELVDERRHEPRPRTAERVTEGDRAAVH